MRTAFQDFFPFPRLIFVIPLVLQRKSLQFEILPVYNAGIIKHGLIITSLGHDRLARLTSSLSRLRSSQRSTRAARGANTLELNCN